MTSSIYSIVPKATFTIVDFNTNRRTVLDSDGNLISTDRDSENIELEFEIEQEQQKKNAEDLKLRNLIFLSKLIYS